MKMYDNIDQNLCGIYNNKCFGCTGASPRDQYDITSVHIGGVKNQKITSQYIGGILGVKGVFFNYINMQYVGGYFIPQSYPRPSPVLHHKPV